MPEATSTESQPTNTCVVHVADVARGKITETALASALEEAVNLCAAIDLKVCTSTIVKLRSITPATYIGSGKIAEITAIIAAHDIDLVMINAALSPIQQRNLERQLKCKVIDRTALILEIFGARASTAEGKLQVELAALTYQKSRLVRSWTHLERQRGGVGFMGGPGESQIEIDRRLIGERIDKIKKQLNKTVRTRELHRKQRKSVPYPIVALVGYTNAGKSTLFNRLTDSTVMAKDMLFATLDPTLRVLTLPSGRKAILADTVGFIADLPTELIAAFRATLEEVLEADVIIHVMDASNEEKNAQKTEVLHVLQNLYNSNTISTPMIEVENKIDQLPEAEAATRTTIADNMALSAKTGEGCERLLDLMDTTLQDLQRSKLYNICFPASSGKAYSWLKAHAQPEKISLSEDGIYHMTATLDDTQLRHFMALDKAISAVPVL